MVLPAAGFGMPTGRSAVPPNVLIRSSLSISGSQHDLELIQLIPLGVGPLSLWNRQKSLQAGTGGKRLRFIHGGIISSFDIVSETGWTRTRRLCLHLDELERLKRPGSIYHDSGLASLILKIGYGWALIGASALTFFKSCFLSFFACFAILASCFLPLAFLRLAASILW